MERDDLPAAATPAAVTEALAANAEELRTAADHHAHGPVVSLRTSRHNGHEIVVRTTYEITVDGRPFEAGLVVDNAGRVHYHGLPTRDFASAVSLVEKAIDMFPEDFAQAPEHDNDHEPEPESGHRGHAGPGGHH